jgi:aspartyl-tRNA(Asn)/glutamyl-tRNA(Gln) amidotransferase subunit B
MSYESVIGLEVHAQLNTSTKIFCPCSTAFGASPNTQTCPVCLGLPGVLPVLNENVLEKAVLAGLSLNASISEYSKFDRKNYFYPDLPKAYQISQYDLPIAYKGHLAIETADGGKRIGITRLHLEEDAGKSIHPGGPSSGVSYVDLNRTGVPLAEIVSDPDIRSGDEAYLYLQKLKSILKYIDVSDVNMEEGSLRCDVNISVRKIGESEFGKKVEIKNLNSFKAVKAAISYEASRQIKLILSGDSSEIVQETRLWNPDTEETVSMRSKEHAHDYRYFPDPDLPPVIISNEYIEEVRKKLPELPDEKKERFISQYGLSEYDAEVLCSSRKLSEYFEKTVKGVSSPKRASNWITSELLARIDDYDDIDKFPIGPERLTGLLKLIESEIISGKIAKQVFQEMVTDGDTAEAIVAKKGLTQVSDTGQIEAIVDAVIAENKKSVDDYKSGKETAIKHLMGQVMKLSKGKANPQIVNDILIKKLTE